MSNKQIASAAKRASAEQLLTNRHDDEIASIADFSDDEEKEIDSVEYLFFLQQTRQETHKASQANFKRQFAMFSSEFRGHANAMVEEMNAYINKLEKDVDTRDAKCVSTQAVVNAAQEWNTQRVIINETRVVELCGIQREEDVNKVSKLIEATGKKRSQAQRRLLRTLKIDLEGLREQEKIVTDAKALVKRYRKLVRK